MHVAIYKLSGYAFVMSVISLFCVEEWYINNKKLVPVI